MSSGVSERWVDLCDERGNHGAFYQVSDLGRVRSLDRRVRTKGDAMAIRRGKIKKLSPHATGYLLVGLTIDGSNKQRMVNRLVAFSFHGEPAAPNMEAAHEDGVRHNNRETNIRWATKIENAADKKRHGTDNRGSTNGRAVLRESQVDVIVDLAGVGERQIDIAASLGINKIAVNHVLRGRTWNTHTGIEN